MENIITLERISIDIGRRKVVVDGKEVELTLMEFKLLLKLMEIRGKIISREKLLTDVWGLESDVNTRTIDTHIKLLRKKLGALGKSIETIRGAGYRFSPPSPAIPPRRDGEASASAELRARSATADRSARFSLGRS